MARPLGFGLRRSRANGRPPPNSGLRAQVTRRGFLRFQPCHSFPDDYPFPEATLNHPHDHPEGIGLVEPAPPRGIALHRLERSREQLRLTGHRQGQDAGRLRGGVGGRLELHFLPPHCRELNPDELVWQELKTNGVGRKPVESAMERHGRVTGRMETLKGLHRKVRSFSRPRRQNMPRFNVPLLPSSSINTLAIAATAILLVSCQSAGSGDRYGEHSDYVSVLVSGEVERRGKVSLRREFSKDSFLEAVGGFTCGSNMGATPTRFVLKRYQRRELKKWKIRFDQMPQYKAKGFFFKNGDIIEVPRLLF